MRISVTGATGFLGRNVVDSLNQQGHQTISWIRHPALNSDRQFDLGQAESIDLRDSDVLVHCAAYLPTNYNDMAEAEKCLAFNGTATLKLLQAAKRDNLKKFVHISTGQLYSWTSDTVASETSSLYPSKRATAYLASKLVGEVYVDSFKKAMSTVILRPSHIYGPEMKKQGLLNRIISALMNDEEIDMNKLGCYNVDLVEVDDVAKMCCVAATGDITGIYNVGGGHDCSTEELVRKIAKMMGKSLKIINCHDLEPGHPPLDISKARCYAGYKPTSIHDGLTKYISSLND